MLTCAQIKSIKPQDRFKLNYRGKTFLYRAMKTPNGIVLVHEGKTHINPTICALPITKAKEYDFIKTEE